jgi:hypothetical protein
MHVQIPGRPKRNYLAPRFIVLLTTLSLLLLMATTLTIFGAEEGTDGESETGYVTLSTAPGDGQLVVDLGAYGDFGYQLLPDSVAPGGRGDALYDPIGEVGLSSTSWESALHLRRGEVITNFLTTGDIAGQGDLPNPGFVVSDSTRAVSTFTVGGLQFVLEQRVEDTFTGGTRTGSALVQVYTMTNVLTSTHDFELIRYYEGDLKFGLGPNVPDGGGHLFSGDTEYVFQTDRAGAPSTAVDFVGVTAVGGTIPTSGRYEVNEWSDFPARIADGIPLADVVYNDGPDEDEFVDEGEDYDVGIALSNRFNGLAPGESVTYTTRTIFGSGAPTRVTLNEHLYLPLVWRAGQ